MCAFDACVAGAKRVRAFNNLTNLLCSCIGCPVRYNGRMVFKSIPEVLSPFARNPIRDRGMASVVARNTWTSLSKGQAISLTRCERPFGGYLAFMPGDFRLGLEPKTSSFGGV